MSGIFRSYDKLIKYLAKQLHLAKAEHTALNGKTDWIITIDVIYMLRATYGHKEM